MIISDRFLTAAVVLLALTYANLVMLAVVATPERRSRLRRRPERRPPPFLAATTFVTVLALAFMPLGPGPVIALSPSPDPAASTAPSPDPGQSIAPDPTPVVAPDPTPPPTPDPVPAASPEPTLNPSPPPSSPPSPAPSADPSPTPSPTPSPEPSADPSPTASPQPSPEPSADPSPTPSATEEPSATATPTATPIPLPTGPHAIAFDATKRHSAATAEAGAFHLTAFTIETWFARRGAGAGDPIGTGGIGTSTGTGGIRSAIPLVTRGAADPARAADVPPRAADRINWFLGVDADAGVLIADFQDAANGSNHPVSGVTVLADDTWYHAAATYDGTTWRLYLNGRLEAERQVGDIAPGSSGTAPVALATSIEAGGSIAHGFFDGTLDETRIWTTARTVRDIRDGMNRPIVKTAAGLVAAWAMDEGGGTTATDVSASDAALVLDGGATWIDSPVPDDTVPAAPRSLAADGGPGSVALAWAAVGAPDLAGYNVYRSTTSTVSTSGDPLNGGALVKSAAYVDDTVAAGVTYRYAITAVDRYANESDPSAEVSATLAPAPTPELTPPPVVVVQLSLTSDAPVAGRHRIDPGAPLSVTVSLLPAADLPSGRLLAVIPEGWTIVNNAGGVYDEGRARLTWALGPVATGATVTRRIELLAPVASPIDGGIGVESTFSAGLEQAGGDSDGPSLGILVAPRIVVEHRRLGQVADRDSQATYLPEDDAIVDEQRFDVFRVRFQLRNADDLPVRITPQLEFRPAGGDTFTVVPSFDSRDGIAFYVAREWRPLAGPQGGSVPGPSGEEIGVNALAIHDRDGADQEPIPGHHSMGPNPMPTLTIPGRSLTEIEFSVRGTVDAQYLASYLFRITDGGAALDDAVAAVVRFGPRPPLLLSPGQRDGVEVDDPLAPAPEGEVTYRLTPPDSPINQPADATAIATTETVGSVRYALLVVAAPAPTGATYPLAAPFENPHGPYTTLTSDACAACHGAHTAQGPNLLKQASPQATLCFTCHDSVGSGATARVEAEYTDPAVPANDPATRSYYRHDALAASSGHTLAENDEFGGLSNRHSECADCHQPHRANDATGAMTAAGWTTPGPLDGVSGVAVTNGTAGAAPTYAFLDGGQDKVTLEYQLCFKCHSGFTVLPSNTGFTPSKYVLDKAIEFNPANGSYHPIEAAGTNSTSQMAASLAGSSPFKQWNFSTTSTIRCLNCHASSVRFDAAAPQAGAGAIAAGANLPAHTSTNRGILLQSYRDRVLKGPLEAYNANDFALCYTCHAEAPFADTSGNVRADTSFRYHGFHVNGTDLQDTGVPGSDIDQVGIGAGLAVCAECHYRIHSTTFAVNGQPAGSRLVNFAPNVTAPTGGSFSWQARTASQAGTCALKCHSKGHNPKSY